MPSKETVNNTTHFNLYRDLLKKGTFFSVVFYSVLLISLGCINNVPDSDTIIDKEKSVCDSDDGGLVLPDGFCATIVIDSLGPSRHIAVAPNGDIYVKIRSEKGGIAALRDTTGDFEADIIEFFSKKNIEGSGYLWETGIAVQNGFIWASDTRSIYRWPIPDSDRLIPGGDPEVIVSNFPDQSSHVSKSFTIDENGFLYVNVGAPSNACQEEVRTPGSPGLAPCPQLENQAGIWRFSSELPGQEYQDGMQFAAGIRHVVGLDWNSANSSLYVAQHGRDQLNTLWPDLYTIEENAELPAEEVFRLSEGANAGWPYCYYDQRQGKKVLAPEYGGDGEEVGRCSDYLDPVTAFPGHWAPNDLLFYTGNQFPEEYLNGAFIAFHGSWNRAPLPQQGYNVAFIPFENGDLSSSYEIFADGFIGEESITSPGDAEYRPMGLAIAPDGALFISDSRKGRIWRVVYTGESE